MMNNSHDFAHTNSEVMIVMKNKITGWLQNRTVLAALLLLLVAGTAVAGIAALRKGSTAQEQDPGSGYALETREGEETADHQSVELESVEEYMQIPVQSDEINAVVSSGKDKKTAEDEAAALEKIQNSGLVSSSKNKPVEEPEEAADPEAMAEEMEAPEEMPANAEAAGIFFTNASRMAWPVEGNVILDYSMDTTTYFSTLKQYKCNPGLLIQSEPGTQVQAAVAGYVNVIGYDEEIGNYIVMDLGGEYSLIYGQLEDIQVALNQVVEAGTVLGTVAEPTKYYVVEGPNLYLELRYQENPVDPLDYIR